MVSLYNDIKCEQSNKLVKEMVKVHNNTINYINVLIIFITSSSLISGNVYFSR